MGTAKKHLPNSKVVNYRKADKNAYSTLLLPKKFVS